MWISVLSIVFHFHVLFAIPTMEFHFPVAPESNMYVFGDSNFETGEKSSGHDSWMKTNYFPYGSSCQFLGISRFSDGMTIPEFIADLFGFTRGSSIDNLDPAMPEKGINFASASAGLLPETGTALGKNLCFKEQIRVFKEHLQTTILKRYQQELPNYLAKSIFLINIGASDYIFNYLQPNYYNTSNRYNDEKFAELLTNEYSNYIKELHELGARKIVIFEIGPLGCLPYMIGKFKPRNGCVENINDMVSKFNNKLDMKLTELRNELKGLHIVTARMFSLIKNIVESPGDYGFQETRWPCCPIVKNGTGLCETAEKIASLELSPEELSRLQSSPEEQQSKAISISECLEFPMSKSSERSQKWTGPNTKRVCMYTRLYVYFDELHLTQAANRIIFQRLIAGTNGSCSPTGIHQLYIA